MLSCLGHLRHPVQMNQERNRTPLANLEGWHATRPGLSPTRSTSSFMHASCRRISPRVCRWSQHTFPLGNMLVASLRCFPTRSLCEVVLVATRHTFPHAHACRMFSQLSRTLDIRHAERASSYLAAPLARRSRRSISGRAARSLVASMHLRPRRSLAGRADSFQAAPLAHWTCHCHWPCRSLAGRAIFGRATRSPHRSAVGRAARSLDVSLPSAVPLARRSRRIWPRHSLAAPFRR